ncbi:Fic family protein [Desulfurivibrio alkaliphilus]|uniref:Putative transcriptional regulator n=1 Tax=Desulfurivibrio alkaliphilus (strain DSM 19089 / UNIQEM U267 / AHT2) TaxID=589865 RepID=D6Z589_DESAT|nr:RNA-binding domain-containing protein [Desulfurivibrio alkaliphilus]ADH84746.1 putative transcriptional regulator [Desulfurivibrio alkaliphilus AHT 2]
MKPSEVKEILTTGEGLHVEFKEARDRLPGSFFDTVCAFLNTDGGTIYLGVNDNGGVTGVEPRAVARLKSDIANLSNNPRQLDPPFLLFPHELAIDGKTVIAVQVPLSSQIHRHGGEIMLRSEDGDYRLRGTHQLAGLANRKLSLFSEQRVLPHLTVADLRPELFDKARSLMRIGDRRHPWLAFSDEELLKVGGFFNRDPNSGRPGLTLAAALLFGSDEVIQNAVPGYKFDCLLRRRNQERYDDRLIVRTNLIDAYDLMMGFIEKHLDDPFHLEGDLRISLREKIFREVVSNIIAHREYTSAAPATIKIYRDRVELENPHVAHFFGRITPDNVRPFPKNPTICKLMIQLGRFDELGSGVINVHRYLPLYANGATPVFQETGHSFVTTLPLTVDREGQGSERATEHATPEVGQQVTQQVIQQVTQQVGSADDYSRLLPVLRACATKSLSNKELQAAAGIRDRSTFHINYLTPLLKLNLLERTIPDKPTSSKQKYRLTEKGRQLLAAANHSTDKRNEWPGDTGD